MPPAGEGLSSSAPRELPLPLGELPLALARGEMPGPPRGGPSSAPRELPLSLGELPFLPFPCQGGMRPGQLSPWELTLELMTLPHWGIS